MVFGRTITREHLEAVLVRRRSAATAPPTVSSTVTQAAFAEHLVCRPVHSPGLPILVKAGRGERAAHGAHQHSSRARAAQPGGVRPVRSATSPASGCRTMSTRLPRPASSRRRPTCSAGAERAMLGALAKPARLSGGRVLLPAGGRERRTIADPTARAPRCVLVGHETVCACLPNAANQAAERFAGAAQRPRQTRVRPPLPHHLRPVALYYCLSLAQRKMAALTMRCARRQTLIERLARRPACREPKTVRAGADGEGLGRSGPGTRPRCAGEREQAPEHAAHQLLRFPDWLGYGPRSAGQGRPERGGRARCGLAYGPFSVPLSPRLAGHEAEYCLHAATLALGDRPAAMGCLPKPSGPGQFAVQALPGTAAQRQP